MSNTLNNARDEAKRIANEVRTGTEKARQGKCLNMLNFLFILKSNN